MRTSPHRRRGAWPALPALALAVALAHVALIESVGERLVRAAPRPLVAPGSRPPAPVLLVRGVASPVPVPMPMPMPSPAPRSPGPGAAAGEQGAGGAVRQTPPTPLSRRAPAFLDEAPQRAHPVAVAASHGDHGRLSASERLPPGAGDPVLPVYPTRLPPAFVLPFELRRGELRAWAQLAWQPEAHGFALRLDARLPGGGALSQTSQGQIDAAGLAPERFVEARSGRAAQAINFQREAAGVSFSSRETLHALRPGSQDPLSWWVQLAAIVEADPSRFEPGSMVRMWVAGVHGDLEPWQLAVDAREDLPGLAADVPRALRLRREPRHRHDAQLEVWLDPARHHLPVRIRLALDGRPALEWWAAAAPASAPQARPARPVP